MLYFFEVCCVCGCLQTSADVCRCLRTKSRVHAVCGSCLRIREKSLFVDLNLLSACVYAARIMSKWTWEYVCAVCGCRTGVQGVVCTMSAEIAMKMLSGLLFCSPSFSPAPILSSNRNSSVQLSVRFIPIDPAYVEEISQIKTGLGWSWASKTLSEIYAI